MDEETARALLELEAAAEPPPTRVDIQRARSRGRAMLRWRRAGLAGVPALAALAVIALIIGAVVPSEAGRHPTARPSGSASPGPVAPPRQFSPLIPYVAFGWLPDGESLDGGQLAPAVGYLTAGKHAKWALTVFAADRCDLTSPQVLRQLHRHRQPTLDCAGGSGAGWPAPAGWRFPVTSIAPRVDGHAAFWTEKRTYLIWEYARRSWATLSGPRDRPAIPEAVKIASNVRYHVAASPSIEFPVQLTGLPPQWRVAATYFLAHAGVLRASQYSLTGGDPTSANVTTDPAAPRSSCYFYPDGQSVLRTINGYRVTVNHLKSAPGSQSVQQVCAPDADGLMVFISTYGKHVTPDAIAIFAHHMRLLGTNPRDWTVRPLG